MHAVRKLPVTWILPACNGAQKQASMTVCPRLKQKWYDFCCVLQGTTGIIKTL